MTIEKIHLEVEKVPYVIVHRSLLQDNKLSLKAKGLLVWLLDKPDTWNCTISGIATQCKDGIDAIKSAIKELKESGYLEITRHKNEKGQHEFSIWKVYQNKKIITTSGKSTCGKSTGGKRHTRKNQEEIPHKDIKKERERKASTSPPSQARRTTAISLDKEKRVFDGITPEDRKAWIEKFPALNVDKEISLCVEWALSNDRKNYRKSILSWLNNATKNHTSSYTPSQEEVVALGSEEDRGKNISICEKIHKRLASKLINPYFMDILNDCVEFGLPNDQGYRVSFALKHEEFLQKCKKAIDRFKEFVMLK